MRVRAVRPPGRVAALGARCGVGAADRQQSGAGLTAAVYLARGGAAEVASTIAWDGGLAIVLTAAYLMTRD